MDLCLNGEARLSEIDEYIRMWHEGSDDRTLDEYLGFTKEEYNLWVQNSDVPKYVLYARRRNVDIYKVIELFSHRPTLRSARILKLIPKHHSYARHDN